MPKPLYVQLKKARKYGLCARQSNIAKELNPYNLYAQEEKHLAWNEGWTAEDWRIRGHDTLIRMVAEVTGTH